MGKRVGARSGVSLGTRSRFLFYGGGGGETCVAVRQGLAASHWLKDTIQYVRASRCGAPSRNTKGSVKALRRGSRHWAGKLRCARARACHCFAVRSNRRACATPPSTLRSSPGHLCDVLLDERRCKLGGRANDGRGADATACVAAAAAAAAAGGGVLEQRARVGAQCAARWRRRRRCHRRCRCRPLKQDTRAAARGRQHRQQQHQGSDLGAGPDHPGASHRIVLSTAAAAAAARLLSSLLSLRKPGRTVAH